MPLEGYDVVWDGTHGGADRDLLNPAMRVPEKRQACEPRPRVNTSRLMILEVLRKGGKVTQTELCELTGLPMGTVNAELYHLRMKGKVLCQDGGGRKNQRGRRLREYWLVEGASPEP